MGWDRRNTALFAKQTQKLDLQMKTALHQSDFTDLWFSLVAAVAIVHSMDEVKVESYSHIQLGYLVRFPCSLLLVEKFLFKRWKRLRENTCKVLISDLMTSFSDEYLMFNFLFFVLMMTAIDTTLLVKIIFYLFLA